MKISQNLVFQPFILKIYIFFKITPAVTAATVAVFKLVAGCLPQVAVCLPLGRINCHLGQTNCHEFENHNGRGHKREGPQQYETFTKCRFLSIKINNIKNIIKNPPAVTAATVAVFKLVSVFKLDGAAL